MELFDKIKGLAKDAGEKTGNAIEIAKLNSRIAKERDRIVLAKKGIGEVYYARLAEGYELLPEASKYSDAIKAAEQAIKEAEDEIARIKAGDDEDAKAEEAAAEPAEEENVKFCAACGAKCGSDAVFCSACGGKF